MLSFAIVVGILFVIGAIVNWTTKVKVEEKTVSLHVRMEDGSLVSVPFNYIVHERVECAAQRAARELYNYQHPSPEMLVVDRLIMVENGGLGEHRMQFTVLVNGFLVELWDTMNVGDKEE